MREKLPFFLHEAVVSLYPASADGTLITGAAVWFGALVNQFAENFAYEEIKLRGAGDAYSKAYHVDEEVILTLGRSWILPKSNAVNDFKPGRNQQYVLQAVYHSDGYWYSRTYYGVTGRSVVNRSQGTNQFLVDQEFRAQYMLDAGGPATSGTYTPITPSPASADPFGFFRELPFVVGEYMYGLYAWQWDVTIGLVELICLAPAEPVVLTLEVNGVLTGQTLTVPGGTPNVAVTVTTNLNGYLVPAGQLVRWQITSGPSPEDSAYQAAMMMQVQVASGATGAAASQMSLDFCQENPLLAGNYLMGQYQFSTSPLQLLSVNASYWPSTGAPVVLGLEIGGVLTGYTLTLPAGTPNQDTLIGSQAIGITAAPLQTVRWKILSAPIPEDSAWHVTVNVVAKTA